MLVFEMILHKVNPNHVKHYMVSKRNHKGWHIKKSTSSRRTCCKAPSWSFSGSSGPSESFCLWLASVLRRALRMWMRQHNIPESRRDCLSIGWGRKKNSLKCFSKGSMIASVRIPSSWKILLSCLIYQAASIAKQFQSLKINFHQLLTSNCKWAKLWLWKETKIISTPKLFVFFILSQAGDYKRNIPQIQGLQQQLTNLNRDWCHPKKRHEEHGFC